MTSSVYKQFISDISDGVNINNLKFDDLARFSVPYPSLPEQRRIVGLLDEAFEGTARAKVNAEKNIQNARGIFESHLQSVFAKPGTAWDTRSLSELGTITSSKRIFKSEYAPSGVPFFRTKEIKELANGRELTTELFISERRYAQIQETFGAPRPGDLLVTAIGTIGEIYVVNDDRKFYFKDGNVLWLQEFLTVNPQFMKYALTSYVKTLNELAHGSAYSALTIERLNPHRIPVPPPEIQTEIVTVLDELQGASQQLESMFRGKLGLLENLEAALLHQAFNGNL